ncbi:protein c-ets-2-B-like [Actinia tenebrosa]|uniref:Protein c-ets-2-B-like n=1 Tax=Actinia tenebrosa TaxID=6105 RepID=A0A6P8J5Z2_ACTTE|nr:protein c-ets-2-B-like [Actinia tenebrosa]
MNESVVIRVLIDDGTPRLPLPFRIQLSLTGLRFKQMIEAQEGFGVSEQELYFQNIQLVDNLTLGQQGVSDESHLDLRVNFQEIPSPTRKKGSTSETEDCVVPDIDDEDNVFNFEQPRVPPDPRIWTKWEVLEWLKWASERYNVRDVTADKFLMNGKGMCMLSLEGFMFRVPRGGDALYKDFHRRLTAAVEQSRHLQSLMNRSRGHSSPGPSNFYYVY